MDIKRTILWVVFLGSLFSLWNNWMISNGKPSMFAPPSILPKVVNHPTNSANGTVSSAAATASVGAAPADDTGSPPAHREVITITTDLVRADIDTLGGELQHLELLKHKASVEQKWYHGFSELLRNQGWCYGILKTLGCNEQVGPVQNVVLFDKSDKRTYLAQTGLIGGDFPNHKSLFIAKPGPRNLDQANEVRLVLEAEKNGVKLTKIFIFKRGDYVIDVKHEVSNTGLTPVTPSLYLQLTHDGTKPEQGSMFTGNSDFYAPAVYTDAEKFQKLDFEKIEKANTAHTIVEHAKAANDGWVAVIQHFFVSAFVPQDKIHRDIFTDKVAANLYSVGVKLPLGTIVPGAKTSMDAHLYSGPQESAVLEKVAPGLDLVKDYGYLKIFAEPMFWVIAQIHHILGNWGWTIIAFTILIKLAFFPLSAAGYRSMGKMKILTPKMQAIRERHKSDPQKMNQAMMELYKTEKANPLGGCLPILIQMPIFIALYWVLQASVEMRGAPWLGWIQNLASPDPLYILPTLYAISMVAQTKLNPSPPTADPMQAKMMQYMPLIFSVMFFFFPSGLVLYWVVNNVLSIAQQWVITKKMESATKN